MKSVVVGSLGDSCSVGQGNTEGARRANLLQVWRLWERSGMRMSEDQRVRRDRIRCHTALSTAVATDFRG